MVITKSKPMTAVNINIEDFLRILINLKQKGVKLVNLDILPDESNPTMNKLIIHPVLVAGSKTSAPSKNIEIKNPEVSSDNDDIFNLFNGII
jgi:hypothetical protein